jgi:hypothetical protein
MSTHTTSPSPGGDSLEVFDQGDSSPELSEHVQKVQSAPKAAFSYFSRVTCRSQFERHVAKVGGTGKLAQIRATRVVDSGSHWTTEHLFAFRVLVKGKGPWKSILPSLKKYVTLKSFQDVSENYNIFWPAPSAVTLE